MHDLIRIFGEIEILFLKKPSVKLNLNELADMCQCSHPTIEKAIFTQTFLSFREYKTKILLKMSTMFKTQGMTDKEISYELGYKWPGNYSRFRKEHKADVKI
jgi:hypothetical protein